MRNGFVGVATPYYVEKGIPYLQSNNVRRNKIDKTQMVYINKEFHENILVVQSGHAGECTVVPKEFEGSNCHALIIMSPTDVTTINSTFCAYYLNSPIGIKKIFPLITGNTVKHILASEMKKLRINLPSLNEQNKLSHFLSTIEKKIELLEAKHENYQNFKKYLMQQIFAQKLRFNFDDEWKRYNLGDISTIGKGFTPSTSNPEYWDGDINWLSIADMNQGKYITETIKKITEEGCKNKKIVEKDTLIMSFKLTIGRLGILKKNMFTNEAICNFKWKNNNILTEYMYYYLSSINILKYGSQAAKGITLNNDTLNTIPVLLPSIDEQ